MGTLIAGLDSLSISEPIFKDVKFYLSGDVPEKISELLRCGGAEQTNYFSDFVSHLICGPNVSENDLNEANDLYEIPAATFHWVVACVKQKKIISTKPYNPSKNQIFSNVVACVCQVSSKDTKILYALITYYGGSVQLKLNSSCTHLIAGATSGSKYRASLNIPLEKLKVVTPDWVTESIKAKMQCPYDAYHPKLLKLPTPPHGANPLTFQAVESRISSITGFDFEESIAKSEVPTQNIGDNKDLESTQALLNKLKQRMPWNNPASTATIVSTPSPILNTMANQSSPRMPLQPNMPNQLLQKPNTSVSAPGNTQFAQSLQQLIQSQQQGSGSNLGNTADGQQAMQMQQQRQLQLQQVRMQMMQMQRNHENQQQKALQHQLQQNFLVQQNQNISQQGQTVGQQSQSYNQQNQMINQPNPSVAQQMQSMGQQNQQLNQQNQTLGQQNQPITQQSLQIQQQNQAIMHQNQAMNQQSQQINQTNQQLSQQNQQINQQNQSINQQINQQNHGIVQQSLGQPNQNVGQQNQLLNQQLNQHNPSMLQQNQHLIQQNQSIGPKNQSMGSQTPILSQQNQMLNQQNQNIGQRNQVLMQDQAISQNQTIGQQQSHVLQQQQQNQQQQLPQSIAQSMAQQIQGVNTSANSNVGQLLSGNILQRQNINQQQMTMNQKQALLNQQQQQNMTNNQGPSSIMNREQLLNSQNISMNQITSQGQNVGQQHNIITMSQQQGQQSFPLIQQQTQNMGQNAPQQQQGNVNQTHLLNQQNNQVLGINQQQSLGLIKQQPQQSPQQIMQQGSNIITGQRNLSASSQSGPSITMTDQQQTQIQNIAQQLQQSASNLVAQNQQNANAPIQQNWRLPNQQSQQNLHLIQNTSQGGMVSQQVIRGQMLQQRSPILQQQMIQNSNMLNNSQTQQGQHNLLNQQNQQIIQQPGGQHVQTVQGGQHVLVQKQLQGSQQQIMINQSQLGNSGTHQQILVQGNQQISLQNTQSQIISQGGQIIGSQSGQQIVAQGQQINQGNQIGERQIIGQNGQGGQQIILQGGQQIISQGGQLINTPSGQQVISQGTQQGGQQILQHGGQQILTQGGQQILSQGGQQIISAQGGQQIISSQGSQQIIAQGQQIISQGGQIITSPSGQQIITHGQQMLQQGQQQLPQGCKQIITQCAQQIVTQGGQLNQAGQQNQQIVQQGQQIVQQGQQIVQPGQTQQVITHQGGQQIIAQAGGQQIIAQGQQIISQGGQQIIQTSGGQQIITQGGQQMVQQPGQQMIWQQQQFLQQRQQQIITGQPGAVGQRVSWGTGTGGRQLIHLDAQTHAQLSQMDPQQRAQFVAQLQKRRQLTMQRTAQQHQVTLVRGQLPQQVQWVQQQGVRVAVPVGDVIPPSPTGTPAPQTPGQPQPPAPHPQLQQAQQQQRQQQQQQFAQLQQQRQQHYAQLHRLQAQKEMVQKQAHVIQNPGVGIVTGGIVPGRPDSVAPSDGNLVTQGPQSDQVGNPIGSGNTLVVNSSKTKTALVNMLSIKLQNTQPTPGGDSVTQEPSAAGTLRLMTAAHNAPPKAPGEVVQGLQQRRVPPGAIHHQQLGFGRPPPPPPVPSPSPAAPPPPRAQFYGHNPNLKLPAHYFLLGCIFHVVEYGTHLAQEWERAVWKHGGEVEKGYSARVTHVLAMTQKHGVVMQALRDVKRCVTAYWLSDTMLRRQVAPPGQALHLPLMYASHDKPAGRHRASISGFSGEDRQRIKAMIEHTGAKVTTYMTRDNTVLVCKRADGTKYLKAKEWGIPVVSAQWVTDILLGNMSALSQIDNAKYQQFNVVNPFRMDYTLVPHLMNAWKMPINITQESHERVRRGALPAPPPKRAVKRPRVPTPPPTPNHMVVEKPHPDCAPRVAFSSVRDVEPYVHIVKNLGGIIVAQATEATHLVMSKLVRTPKLISCLVTANHILSTSWLVESNKAGKFLEETKFAITNEQFREVYKCDIPKILAVGDDRRKLFDGITFYMTPCVQPNRATLTELIELCGGKVDKVRKSFEKIQEQHKEKPNSYLVLTVPNDLHLVYYILQADKNLNIVCNTELVFSSIMQMKLEVSEYLVKVD